MLITIFCGRVMASACYARVITLKCTLIRCQHTGPLTTIRRCVICAIAIEATVPDNANIQYVQGVHFLNLCKWSDSSYFASAMNRKCVITLTSTCCLLNITSSLSALCVRPAKPVMAVCNFHHISPLLTFEPWHHGKELATAIFLNKSDSHRSSKSIVQYVLPLSPLTL